MFSGVIISFLTGITHIIVPSLPLDRGTALYRLQLLPLFSMYPGMLGFTLWRRGLVLDLAQRRFELFSQVSRQNNRTFFWHRDPWLLKNGRSLSTFNQENFVAIRTIS